jgi:DNA replicative helicase MCM subunit Mcm2 (Cdc46/Mcm family)
MAEHIVDVHQGNINMELENADIPIPLMKKYIAYARSKVSPRLTEVILLLIF